MQYQKQADGVPNTLTNILTVSLAFWHLPKYIIVLLLLVKDTAMGITKLAFFLHQKTSKQQTVAKAESEHKELHETTTDSSQVPHHYPSKKEEPLLESSPRRRFLQTASLGLATVPYIVVGKGLLQNVHDFQVEKIDILLPNLPRQLEGLTITQLSDIHAGSFFSSSPVQEMRRIANDQKSDLMMMTGDWVNFRPAEMSVILPDVQKLTAPLGVYGSLGNHDHYMKPSDHTTLIKTIKNTQVQLMINENRKIMIEGIPLQLAATDNEGLGQHFADLHATLNGLTEEYPIFMMSHDPTFWDQSIRKRTPVDVMFAGHTHGGQIGMELFGQSLSPVQMVYKQWAGLYSDTSMERTQHLYVNRGIGTTGVPIRIGILPEITVFTLRKAV
jgi:predicted MPP superfamily phosphohydrolase